MPGVRARQLQQAGQQQQGRQLAPAIGGPQHAQTRCSWGLRPRFSRLVAHSSSRSGWTPRGRPAPLDFSSRLLTPPAGPQAQGWTGRSQDHCQCQAGEGAHPLAIGQDRPSRLGPPGEGRSDSRVLHLHQVGHPRYPEGGRRREDEPPRGRVARSRQCGRRRAPREPSNSRGFDLSQSSHSWGKTTG